MRILHFTWHFGLGGLEAMLADIANVQARTDSITVLVVNDVIDSNLVNSLSPRIRLIQCARPPSSKNPLYMCRMILSAITSWPHVVHSHCHNGKQMLGLLNVPFVVTVHDTRTEAALLSRFDKVFAISEAVRDQLQDENPDLRPIVVPNGVAFETIAPAGKKLGSPFRIVCVSRLYTEKKGQHILIAALSRLSAAGHGNITLDLVGDGPSRAELERQVSQMGLDNKVRFLGTLPREAVYKSLGDYHLLVQPSLWEGFGLTVVEGMAAKIPVLASNIEGPMEILSGGKYGYVFKVGDADDCAKMILRVRSEYGTQEFGERIGIAYDYARSNYSVETTARRYFDEYRTLVHRV